MREKPAIVIYIVILISLPDFANFKRVISP